MGKAPAARGTAFGRDVFLTGKYSEQFCPDSRRNPFWKLYGRKKRDAIGIISNCRMGAVILDVGAGMGRLSLGLAKAARYRIFPVDISIDMLKLALDSAKGVQNVERHEPQIPEDDVVGRDERSCNRQKGVGERALATVGEPNEVLP